MSSKSKVSGSGPGFAAERMRRSSASSSRRSRALGFGGAAAAQQLPAQQSRKRQPREERQPQRAAQEEEEVSRPGQAAVQRPIRLPSAWPLMEPESTTIGVSRKRRAAAPAIARPLTINVRLQARAKQSIMQIRMTNACAAHSPRFNAAAMAITPFSCLVKAIL